MITWAVGHLVQLAEPDEYDPKYKSWRMADLPIVPERFKLVVRDERSRKQMSVVTKQLAPRGRRRGRQRLRRRPRGRADLRLPLREGRSAKKPVRRLWLNSMTSAAMQQRVRVAAPGRGVRAPGAGRALALGGRLDRRHERDARGDDPPAQRPSTAPSRSGACRRRRSRSSRGARRRSGRSSPSPTGSSTRRFAGGRSRTTSRRARATRVASTAGRRGSTRAGSRPRQEALAIVAAVRERRGRRSPSSRRRAARESADALRPDDAAARGQQPLRLLGTTHAGAAQRLYEEHKALTYPRTSSRYLTTRHGRGDQADRRAGRRAAASTAKAAQYVTSASTCCRSARVVNDEKVTDHHAIIPTRSEHHVEKMGSDDRRVYDMVVRRFLAVFHPEAVFENTRVETTVARRGRDVVFRTRGKAAARARAGAASTTRSPRTRAPRPRAAARRTRTPTSSCRGCAQDEPVADARGRERAQGNQTAAPLQRRLAAGRDGDRRASSSTTTSCARR